MKKIITGILMMVLISSGLIGCTASQEAIEVGNPPTSESTMPEVAHLMGITFSGPVDHNVEQQDDESIIVSGPALLLTADAFESGKEISDFLDEISDKANETFFELDTTTSCNQFDDGYLVLGECRGADFVVQYRIEYDESLGLDELPKIEIGVDPDKKERYYGEIKAANPHYVFTKSDKKNNDPIASIISATPPTTDENVD